MGSLDIFTTGRLFFRDFIWYVETTDGKQLYIGEHWPSDNFHLNRDEGRRVRVSIPDGTEYQAKFVEFLDE